jgi:hypothetical protein
MTARSWTWCLRWSGIGDGGSIGGMAAHLAAAAVVRRDGARPANYPSGTASRPLSFTPQRDRTGERYWHEALIFRWSSRPLMGNGRHLAVDHAVNLDRSAGASAAAVLQTLRGRYAD